MTKLPRIEPDQALIGLLQDTTIHGLNHVYSAKLKFMKCIWLLLFILGIAGFSFNLVYIMKKFLSNPILVSTFVDSEKFVWPDLTFCNPTAPFDLEKNKAASEYWKKVVSNSSEIVKILVNKSRLAESLKKYEENIHDIVEKAVVLSSANLTKLRVDDFENHVRFYGFSEDHEKIYLLKADGREATDFVNKNPKELFSTKFVQFGNSIPCYTFQIEKSKSINFTRINSLLFFINLNYESHKLYNLSFRSRSFLLYITSKFHLPEKEKIILSPGYINEVTIVQNRFHRSSVKNPCRPSSYIIELYDTVYRSTYKFEGSYDDCRKVLSQKLFVENCHCYNPYLPVYKNVSGPPLLCFNTSTFSLKDILKNSDCIDEVYKRFSKNSTFKDISQKECDKYKALKCNELIYKGFHQKRVMYELDIEEMSDNMQNNIRSDFVKLFNKNFSADAYRLIKGNLGLLTIKRKSQFGDLIKEESEYSFSNLISDVGGLMGIWLGLSVIGLCEIVGFIYFFSMRMIDMGINRKQRQENPLPMEQTAMIST